MIINTKLFTQLYHTPAEIPDDLAHLIEQSMIQDLKQIIILLGDVKSKDYNKHVKSNHKIQVKHVKNFGHFEINDDKLKTMDLCLIKKGKGISTLINIVKFGKKCSALLPDNYIGECELLTFKISVSSLI